MSGTEGAAGDTDHPLRMNGRSVFYSFSFDLGPGLDIVKLADTLLEKDMAAGAASPSDNEIRVSKRGFALEREQANLRNIHGFLNLMFSESFSWKKSFGYDRRSTVKMMWIHRKMLTKYWVFRVLFGVSRTTNNNEDEDIQAPPEWVLEAQKEVGEIAEDYTKMLFNNHILGATRIRLEQSLYFPGYLDSAAPFLRVEMNPAYFSDRDFTDEPIEISLMLHRSGICILTFAMPVAEEFGVAEAFNLMQAGKRGFGKFEISFPIMGEPDGPISLIETDTLLRETTHGGMSWLSAQIPAAYSSESVFTVDSIFERYWYAITEAADQKVHKHPNKKSTNRLPGWRCHTTLFQSGPACACEGNEAKEKHRTEFAQIMVRASIELPVQERVRDDFLENHLVEASEELWLAAGHSIHTIWGGHGIDYVRDLRTIIAIESAILQHRQLQAIDHRTVQTQVRDRDLSLAQDQLATGLPEYGRVLLADQNGHRIVSGLSDRLQTPDLYRRLNDRVKVLESIVNTRFTRKQARRSLALSLIGVAIVLSLLLPRVTEFVAFLNSMTPTRPLVSSVNDFFDTENGAALAVYSLIVLAAILFFILFPTPPAKRPFLKLRRKPSFGYRTHGSLQIRSDTDYSDDDDGEQVEAI